MKTKYQYYFKNYKDNEIFQKLLTDVKNVWEIRDKAKEYLKAEIQEKGVKENNGELLGKATLIGNYYIGKGTKIYGGVTI